ncbi:protein translocase subunit SecD [Muribaculaceae bacterium Isolate-113 (HZI)]|jgi:SecD/SecF fusion protein|uniref:protein translocase subunit SecD n=1 Tax=Sangeribacter muris TaxID=2880703 RepID=UPI000F4A4EA8|nr:protein translocase subunit SecD [Sangeribacter muris]ROT22657.1 protein translocase subunit SecD [Muribaculaceae bacterium Isolate-114 (HZI)]ROT24828.1 protein translocase subunit SecD [Muribaculaceae bacterium Isolate-113 (HZI)]RXE68835.1 protein translocase subunit SecD [Muribaculaceae bacterium Isolate-001 (NCI)]
MQNKGFISTIAILLVLICGFYISFSFVTSHYEKKAKEFAAMTAKTSDETNDVYKQSLKQFNDSIDKEKVYLWYTYNQVRKMEVGLGLDLKGGMNVVLEISVPDILRQYASGDAQLAQINTAIKKAEADGGKGSDKDFVSRVASYIQPGVMASLFVREGEYMGNLKSNASNEEVTSALEKQVDSQVDAAFNIFRTRIDQFGVVAPNIQKLQDKNGQILLELPGVKEPERVTELLKSSANLEFFEVYNYNEILGDLQRFAAAFAQQDTVNHLNVIELLGGPQRAGSPIVGMVTPANKNLVDSVMNTELAKRTLPSDLSLMWSVKQAEFPVTDANGNVVKKDNGDDKTVGYWELIALKGDAVLEGDAVTSASSEYDNMQGNMVNMKMNDRGAQEWATITRNNIGRPIAIVLDEHVYSFPNVNNEITGGSSQITGNFTPEEANDLANVLKSGKMSAKVNVVSNNVIGPSLGAEAIQMGFISFIVAIILLMILMVAYYGWIPGLVANVGLILNLFFTLGILASLQAVLTLSGIAGIVLALGMAVDANVLIFERTKEELKSGKKLRQAIAEGYGNAFSAIFDSNLTSVITGVILLYFGSGPIKGFATTLIIGIVCSFFTAVFLTRIAFDLITKNGRCANMTFTTALSRNFLTSPKVNFMGKSKAAAAVWIALIVVSIASLAIRGMNQGIDFSGGRNYVVQFEKDVDRQAVQEKLLDLFQTKANDPTVSVAVINIDNPSKLRISTNYKIAEESEGIENEVASILYEGLKDELTVNGQTMSLDAFSVSDESHGIISIQKVGPSVADDMKRDAAWALGIAVVCMFLYILLRFRNIAFSVGAVCAVALTAFLIVGFYSICWGFLPFSMEIDQSFIAAVLTIIGYQINDTVVVFDRVREMIGIYPKEDRFKTFNKSLNQTLGRTVMTSFSTLLVLLCIFFLGGDTIRSFTFAMIFGVVVGTFCSLFCAAPIAYSIMARNSKKNGSVAEADGKPALEGNRRFK